MSPESSFSDEERRFFRANYAIDEDGKTLLSVRRTYYQHSTQQVVIIPHSGRTRGYDEYEEAVGPVFTLGRDEACTVIILKRGNAYVFELAHLALDEGAPSIEAAGCIVVAPLSVHKPQILRADEIITGEGMLTLPLKDIDWVKIIQLGDVPLERDIPSLASYSAEEQQEIVQPARLMRLVREFHSRGR